MASLSQSFETVKVHADPASQGGGGAAATADRGPCTCTCPVTINGTMDLCPACEAEYRSWADVRPFPDSEDAEDAFPDSYPDEPPCLPDSVYHSPLRVRIGTMVQLLDGEVSADVLAKTSFSDLLYVEVRDSGSIVEFRPFADEKSARAYALSLFGEGGYEELGDDPFEDETYSPLEWWLEYADPTEDMERDEATARTQLEWGR